MIDFTRLQNRLRNALLFHRASAVNEPVETQLFVTVLCGPKRQREEPEKVVVGQTGVEMSVD